MASAWLSDGSRGSSQLVLATTVIRRQPARFFAWCGAA